MRKTYYFYIIILMSFLGAISGLVLHIVMMPNESALLGHCIFLSTVISFCNSFIVLMIFKMYSAIKNYSKNLEQEIRIDKITGLLNNKALDYDINNFNLDNQYSVIYIDIDNFRNFNNTYGHQVGDKTLKICSNVIKKSIGIYDRAYRCGGDEILVVLAGYNKEEAVQIGNKIIKNMSEYDNSPYPSITISAGLSSFPYDSISFEQVVKNGDTALLRAKKLGRNQLVVFPNNLL